MFVSTPAKTEILKRTWSLNRANIWSAWATGLLR
ncbi:hypothetical protein CsSME_00025161 [Camellia sinensis var. sinensis]